MTAIDLLPPPSQRLPRHAAAKLLAACRAEFELLLTFKSEVNTLSTDPARVARSDELRSAWSRWADDTSAVLARVADDESVDGPSRRRLEAEIGFARYVVTLDRGEMRRRLDEVLAGNYVDGEQLRRELVLPRRR